MFVFSAICQSQFHEVQRYGKRTEGMANAQRVNRALFINKVVENAENQNAAGVH